MSVHCRLVAGMAGCGFAIAGCWVANFYLKDGIRLIPTPSILIQGMLLSVLTGMLAGMYPAWRASRWSPMEAIRYDP